MSTTNYIFTGAVSGAFGTTTNFTPNGTPVTDDNILFDGRMQQALVGSNNSGVTLITLTQKASAQFAIGSAATQWQISATTAYFGVADDDGSSSTPKEACINFGSVQNATWVYSTAASGTYNLPPLLLKGTHASNVLNVVGGIVGIAEAAPGEVATFATVNVIGPNANVTLGAGCTLTNITQDDGFFLVKAATTSIVQNKGTFETRFAAANASITCNGTANIKSTGTIAAMIVKDDGFVDFDGVHGAITVTNCTVYGNGKIRDTNKRVVWSNPISFPDGLKPGQLEIGEFGTSVTIQPA